MSHSISLRMLNFLLASAQLKKQKYTHPRLNSQDQSSPLFYIFQTRHFWRKKILFVKCYFSHTLPVQTLFFFNNSLLNTKNNTWHLTHSTQVWPCQYYGRLLVFTVPLPSGVTWLHNTSFSFWAKLEFELHWLMWINQCFTEEPSGLQSEVKMTRVVRCRRQVTQNNNCC